MSNQHPDAEIQQGNTLTNPLFMMGDTLKIFDYVVANPPFSDKRWSTGLDPTKDDYQRFEGFGIPPGKQGDYAYLLHILRSLKSTGKGACILPHGVLFRGNAEAEIRRNLIKRGYIKAIIGLPPNLFYGTGIPACIVVLDKAEAAKRQGIFMIDGSGEFIKDGNKNRLRDRDIHKIVDVFKKQLEVPKYSRFVSLEEIEKNDFNLNIPRYIDSQPSEDSQDIEGHLQGGIPDKNIADLAKYWEICPSLKSELFGPCRPNYSALRVVYSDLKQTINDHPEFKAFMTEMKALFIQWQEEWEDKLKGLEKEGFKPKSLIWQLGESLLSFYTDKPLIDKYGVYQYLRDYWLDTMQDDCYWIAEQGWQAQTTRIIEKNKRGKEIDKGWTCDLIPKFLIMNRYFFDEQEKVTQLETDLETLTTQKTELEEENGGDEGAFSELEKVNKATVSARIKELKQWTIEQGNLTINDDNNEELLILEQWLKLYNQETRLKKKIKEAENKLDLLAYEKYPQLTEDEIKTLVVNDKWMNTLAAAIEGEMERISQGLTQRVKELGERYEKPLPLLMNRVDELTAKVEGHLQTMGFNL
ncbi:N-6 DNA methylase [Cyanothece sp. BG0011]|uniref:N-6 DNA methylase n=1 Tax=Cyanothece sp. BG0011 TaxID=2082950 RepID=UPI000D1E8032|nr:N-6 DNA methylase [Cyanothece sp. BG0011]